MLTPALNVFGVTCFVLAAVGLVLAIWALAAQLPLAPAAGIQERLDIRIRRWIKSAIAGFLVSTATFFILGFGLSSLPRAQPEKANEDPVMLAKVTAPADQQPVEKHLWTRYQDVHSEFSRKAKVNWYLYANLRVLIIVLGALTPVLIYVTNKKWAPALTAAVVAVAAGMISEFDFRQENARYEDALAALDNNAARFIAHSGPDYRVCPGEGFVCPNSDKDSPVHCTDDGLVCHKWQTTVDSFVDHIEQIVRDERDGRIRFLRGVEGKEAEPTNDRKSTDRPEPKSPKPKPAKKTT